jgi:VanZ family protein
VTFTRLFRLAGVTGVFLIIALSLIPRPYRPHTGAPGGLEHFFAYAATALALALGWRSLAHVMLIAVGLLVLGGLELVQLFVPGRSSDLVDALVSGLGGLCGVVLATGLARWAPSARSGGPD